MVQAQILPYLPSYHPVSSNFLFSSFCFQSRKRMEAGRFWCLPPVWNHRAVSCFHFSICWLFCLVLLLSSPFPFLWSILPTIQKFVCFFFQKQAFFFVWRLFFCFVFKHLGDNNQQVICEVWCLLALVLASCAFRCLIS